MYDEERGHIHRYQERLLGRFSTLKRMIKRRKDRIKEKGKEKTEIEKEIRKLRRKIDTKTREQGKLKGQIGEIKKELKVYTDHFKELGEDLDKKPNFYIKIHTTKEGYQYYHGRIRFFMRHGRKRREKWFYFGSVSKMNRKYGDKVEEVLEKKLKQVYYEDLYGEYMW